MGKAMDELELTVEVVAPKAIGRGRPMACPKGGTQTMIDLGHKLNLMMLMRPHCYLRLLALDRKQQTTTNKMKMAFAPFIAAQI